MSCVTLEALKTFRNKITYFYCNCFFLRLALALNYQDFNCLQTSARRTRTAQVQLKQNDFAANFNSSPLKRVSHYEKAKNADASAAERDLFLTIVEEEIGLMTGNNSRRKFGCFTTDDR